jgi:hypothetical protein
VAEEEDRAQIDCDAIRSALAGAAHVQMEGRVMPVMRVRAEGISRAGSLAEKLRVWARLNGCDAGPLKIAWANLGVWNRLGLRKRFSLFAAIRGNG